jgi:hypothetical protein
MVNGEGMPQITKQNVDDLEPYRRLVEIQKQLIEMANQHEQGRRACDALREQVTREVMASVRGGGRLRHRISQSASRLFKRLPRNMTAGTFFRSLNNKQTFSC